MPTYLRANGKLRKALVDTFRGLSKGLLAAVWSESGESGRESVGDGVPTPRLFLLLLRQLFERFSSDTETKGDLLWLGTADQ